MIMSEPNNQCGNTTTTNNTQQHPNNLEDDQISLLRKSIQQIHANESISPEEKARAVQSLMTLNYSRHLKISNVRTESASLRIEEVTSAGCSITMNDGISSHQQQQQEEAVRTAKSIAACTEYEIDPNTGFPTVAEEDFTPLSYWDKEKEILGCKHYSRNCKVMADCCKRFYCCRFCHDNDSEEAGDGHLMDRFMTKYMLCLFCKTSQSAAQECLNCHRRMAKYYCDKCKFWDNAPDKHLYHCHACNLCRVGRQEDYFHCNKCNACLNKELSPEMQGHRCIERNLESNCPICGEFLFTSRLPITFMRCGHGIHSMCFREYTQSSYQCPVCLKSLANMTEFFQSIDTMLAEHKMPEEYSKHRSCLSCNDCEGRSEAPYHFLYHKCQLCGSYNTKVLQIVAPVLSANQDEAHDEINQ